jgi:septum site-determining protein MinC
MAAVPKANPASLFDLKSATVSLVAVVLKTTDLALLETALKSRLRDAPALFDHEPVAIDLSRVRDAGAPLDFPGLIALLRQHGMAPMAVKAGTHAQMQAALAAGLMEAHHREPGRGSASPEEHLAAGSAVTAPRAAPAASAAEVPDTPPAAATPAAMTPTRAAMVIDRPLRSGQQVYAKGCDLIVLAVVSFGAEVIADGNIHVYAPLRGRALAGAHGDTTARIFTTCLEPQLVSIAGIYRTTEQELPADVLGKPAQIWLDGESLVIEPLNA